MPRPSYPRPETLPGRAGHHTPRQLIPIDTAADWGSPPSLPSPPRTFPDPSWVLSTHLVPCALPRTVPDVPPIAPPAWSGDRARWKAAAEKTAEQMIATRLKQWSGELQGAGSRKPLWACLNRYRRRDASLESGVQGVTLFFVHPTGFPKEIWEPVFVQLLKQREVKQSSYHIAEVWAWEAVNHGDSYLINKANLGGIFDWQDNSRDILQFLLHYLPERTSTHDLPVHLPALPTHIVQARRAHGFASRMLVGVAHSLGGTTLLRAAIAEQALLDALVLIDPIIRPRPRTGPLVGPSTRAFTLRAVQRQTRWASRDDAKTRFLASPFFQAWHPAALDVYVECGLVAADSDAQSATDGGVELKTSNIQEALTFTETMTPHDTWDLLDTLDARVPLLWILPGKEPDLDMRAQMVWRRPENARNVVIPGAGHLVAQEAPVQLAEELDVFLQRLYGAPPSRL